MHWPFILFHQEAPTGMSFIIMAKNGRSSEISHDGANRSLSGYPVQDMEWMLDRSDCCLLDGALPKEVKQTVMKWCKEKNLPCDVR